MEWKTAGEAKNVSFADWAAGEPNNWGGREDCAHYSWHKNYQWNDVPCDRKMKYVCEYEGEY